MWPAIRSGGQLSGTRAASSRASASRSAAAARQTAAPAAIRSSRGVEIFSTGSDPASPLAVGFDEGRDPLLVGGVEVQEVQPAAQRQLEHLPVALRVAPRHLDLRLHRLLVVEQVEGDAEQV